MKNSEVPRVAVITPYFDEGLHLLEKCHLSVMDQTQPVLHVMVADGRPRLELNDWSAHHVVLPKCHNDVGSTPRLIGCYHAIGLGVDAVAFLDADNWYEADHIQGLLEALDENDAAFASSSRMLWSLDGYSLGPCPTTCPDSFIDTSCMLFGRKSFSLLHHWVLMPQYGHAVSDRIMYHHLRESGLPLVHVPKTSVNYRCGKPGIYDLLNAELPKGIGQRPEYERSFDSWVRDGNPPLTRNRHQKKRSFNQKVISRLKRTFLK
jgi:hypothetical protein